MSFPNNYIKTLLRYTSNHDPVLKNFSTNFIYKRSIVEFTRPTRFEITYQHDEENNNIVKSS